MNHVTFRVEGMHCSGCAATIQALLESNAGVRSASTSFDEHQARVLYDPGAVSEAELIAMIEKAGYRVTERKASS
jgi:copper chaperone CopZ